MNDLLILHQLNSMISTIKGIETAYSMETEYDSLELSSLDFITLVVLIETKYEKEFNDEDLVFAKYKTVRDIINVIKKMIAED